MREKARATPTIANATRIQAFVTAAKAFIDCARDSPSKQANERRAYYEAAAECYSEIHDLKRAGDNYRKAEKYDAAARNYREGEHFDALVEVITQHGNAMGSALLERSRMAAQMHYFKVCLSGRIFPNTSDFL